MDGVVNCRRAIPNGADLEPVTTPSSGRYRAPTSRQAAQPWASRADVIGGGSSVAQLIHGTRHLSSAVEWIRFSHAHTDGSEQVLLQLLPLDDQTGPAVNCGRKEVIYT